VSAGGGGLLAEGERGVRVAEGVEVELWRDDVHRGTARIGALPPIEKAIRLSVGERLILDAGAAPGNPEERDEEGGLVRPARIGCTLPEIFGRVAVGDRVLFDDGKLGGRVVAAEDGRLVVEVTRARGSTVKLRGDQGINLPDTDLALPCLTDKDLADLDFIARHADLVGQSFVRRVEDVRRLHDELAARGASRLGVMLKIENRAAFEHLPQLLLAALASPPAGVMVARGDLGVELGFDRLAEVQEEILWLAEAAHLPVVWATQVLEGMAKKGMPSRAEVTDAAMSVRAECVMLNKGPQIVDTVRFLCQVLRRMQDHQAKKRSMLRRLAVSRLAPA
jgi:pyruvate kinase